MWSVQYPESNMVFLYFFIALLHFLALLEGITLPRENLTVIPSQRSKNCAKQQQQHNLQKTSIAIQLCKKGKNQS